MKLAEESVKLLRSKTSSAWNKGGTWEDKKLKKEVFVQVIKDCFIDNKDIQKAFKNFSFVEIRSLTGDGSIVTVRGKKKLGYELKMELIVRSIS